MNRNIQLTSTLKVVPGVALAVVANELDKWPGRFDYIHRVPILKDAHSVGSLVYTDRRWGMVDPQLVHVWKDEKLGILVGMRTHYASANYMGTVLVVAFDPEVTGWNDAVAVFLTLVGALTKIE